MSPEAFLAIIIGQYIAITPILRKGERKGTTIAEYWTAAFRELGDDGWTNHTPNDQFATGSTPIDAVEKLLAGKTVYVDDPEHGLIRRTDLPTPRA